MCARMVVPEELQHLIEKRERAADRREKERRKEDIGPLGAFLSADSIDDVPDKDRRGSKKQRRKRRRRED